MMPVILGKKQTIRNIIRYTFALYLVSLTPYFFKFAGILYFLSAILLGGIFVFFALSLKEKSKKSATNLFKYSILYLFLLYLILIIDSFFKISTF